MTEKLCIISFGCTPAVLRGKGNFSNLNCVTLYYLRACQFYYLIVEVKALPRCVLTVNGFRVRGEETGTESICSYSCKLDMLSS